MSFELPGLDPDSIRGEELRDWLADGSPWGQTKFATLNGSYEYRAAEMPDATALDIDLFQIPNTFIPVAMVAAFDPLSTAGSATGTIGTSTEPTLFSEAVTMVASTKWTSYYGQGVGQAMDAVGVGFVDPLEFLRIVITLTGANATIIAGNKVRVHMIGINKPSEA